MILNAVSKRSLIAACCSKSLQQRIHAIQPWKRSFHFASSYYNSCFRNLPQPNVPAIRKSAQVYLEGFNSQLWYSDPIATILNGEQLQGGTESDTVDALGASNGRQRTATPEQVQLIKEHLLTYETTSQDLRERIRLVEQLLFSKHCGYLIGNQCVDFQKQNGVIEMEEAIRTIVIEQRLNDRLLEEEAKGHVTINRKPIYVSTDSSSTNFMDLSRKVLRSLEVGIPVVVLGCTESTSQHIYRWTQLLADICADAGVDLGMIAYLSCRASDIQDIIRSCAVGNLYATCPRNVAADMKAMYPKTVALTTSGPNTMVCADWADTESLREAISSSASIESGRDLTALRHCVVPTSVPDSKCEQVFDGISTIEDATAAMEHTRYAGVFADTATCSPDDSYRKHEKASVFLKLGLKKLPERTNDYSRQVVVDFTKMDLFEVDSDGKRVIKDAELNRVAQWLNKNQPNALAVNGSRQDVTELGLKLWEKTNIVVNTVGSTDDPAMPPAMTCHAQSHQTDITGECSTRHTNSDHTAFPIVIPSSNPSYDTVYTINHLKSKGSTISQSFNKSTRVLVEAVGCAEVRGYCVLLIEYLQNLSSNNPRKGFGTTHTSLWGVQRPPLGLKTLLDCGQDSSWDDIAPIFVLFHATNARSQVELSIDPTNDTLLALATKHKLTHTVETREDMKSRLTQSDEFFSVVDPRKEPTKSFSMVGNFVSLYFPFGHVKSTMPNDEEFDFPAHVSEKWLISLF